MGSCLVKEKECRLTMIGLDATGKTTILYKLKLGEIVFNIPQIGFSVETIEFNDMKFTIWDVKGQTEIRPLWRHYYQNIQALIFVIDSNDRQRLNPMKLQQSKSLIYGYLMDEDIPTSIIDICHKYYYEGNDENESAKEILYGKNVLNHAELVNVPLLIFANKQDLPNAMSVDEIENTLELDGIKDRDWHIEGCCATTGDGLYEGLNWIYKILDK